jgi:hypothetical protein
MKGIYTQGVIVLLRQAVALNDLASALQGYSIDKRIETSTEWALGGPTLSIPYRPEVNGSVVVDIADHPWPDDMGHPRESPMVFMAWTMGNFGPHAYPGGLTRAVQQAWHWDGAAKAVEEHQAFIRLRSTYVFGGRKEDPVAPPDYDPLDEVNFVLRVAQSVMRLPQALAFFNPNGEMLFSAQGLNESLQYGAESGLPPLDAISNVRYMHVSPEWSFMDTVGLSQLDLPDIEACFSTEDYQPGEVAHFLRNLSLYRFESGDVFEPDNTADGPGGVHWRVRPFEESLTDPPRRVLRWIPMDDREPLPEFGFSN